jgi:hypothetical protein
MRQRCVVKGPASGYVQAHIPGNVVCTDGVCNAPSNFVRTQIEPTNPACVPVQISSPAYIGADGVLRRQADGEIPLEFKFNESVAKWDYDRVEAWGFSSTHYMMSPELLTVSHVKGEGTEWTVSVTSPENKRFDRVEIFMRRSHGKPPFFPAFCTTKIKSHVCNIKHTPVSFSSRLLTSERNLIQSHHSFRRHIAG